MFGLRSDFGDNAIDRNRHSGRMEEIARVGVEHRDSPPRVIKGNGVVLADLEIAERKVAEIDHLHRHLMGGRRLAPEIWLGDDDAGVCGIEITFQAHIVAEFPVLENHTGEVFRGEKFPGEHAFDGKRREHFVVKIGTDPGFSRMSGLPPDLGARVVRNDMLAVSAAPVER